MEKRVQWSSKNQISVSEITVFADLLLNKTISNKNQIFVYFIDSKK